MSTRFGDLSPRFVALNAAALERAGLLVRAERCATAPEALACRVWLRATSRANFHGRRSKAMAHNAEHRDQTRVALVRVLGDPPPGPVVVTMERRAPPSIDGHDNLPGAFKGITDGVALWLGLDDRDPRIAWRYLTRRDKDWSVVITVQRAASRPAPCGAVLDLLARLAGDTSREAEALRDASRAFLRVEGVGEPPASGADR